jgi:hypothetical protein
MAGTAPQMKASRWLMSERYLIAVVVSSFSVRDAPLLLVKGPRLGIYTCGWEGSWGSAVQVH